MQFLPRRRPLRWGSGMSGCRPYLICFLQILVFFPALSWALDPEQVLVLANRNAARSIGLAHEYMEKRRIPEDQLLVLWLTDKETCTREAYEKKVLGPVVAYIEEHREKDIRCLATVYGVPLRVLPSEMTAEERARYESLEQEHARVWEALQQAEKKTDEAKKLAKQHEKPGS